MGTITLGPVVAFVANQVVCVLPTVRVPITSNRPALRLTHLEQITSRLAPVSDADLRVEMSATPKFPVLIRVVLISGLETMRSTWLVKNTEYRDVVPYKVNTSLFVLIVSL